MDDKSLDKGPDSRRTESPLHFNPAGLAIGVGAGVALGVALDNIGVGIAIGVGVGMVFSLALSRKNTGESGSDGA